MLFNDPIFIFLYLPVVFFIYFFLNHCRGATCSKIWLVLSSLFFYGYWNSSYLFLIGSSMIANFLVSRLFQSPKLTQSRKKILLITSVILNIIVLCYYKYIDFFIGNLNFILSCQLEFIQPLLPLAISFYTFQQIAFLIDTYKEGVCEYSFLNYCLFITFFPHMIAGPITHHKEMMPQFANENSGLINLNNISKGLFIFSIGLFKKVYIADSFAMWANEGFAQVYSLGFVDAWLTSLSYTFQLYYDFSGYSDMAIGCALLFNIRLPINFNSPYKSKNIQDFWRRWHMTLSRWLRDYIYIPLGGNRLGSLQTYFNIFVTFLIGGIWHGANWTFVIWGAMHGSGLLVHRLWLKFNLHMPAVLAWFFTFAFINATWVMFRADNGSSALHMLHTMFTLKDTVLNQQLYSFIWDSNLFLFDTNVFIHTILFGILSILGINSMQMGGLIQYTGFLTFNRSLIFAIYSALLVTISVYCLLIVNGESEFLYFNF